MPVFHQIRVFQFWVFSFLSPLSPSSCHNCINVIYTVFCHFIIWELNLCNELALINFVTLMYLATNFSTAPSLMSGMFTIASQLGIFWVCPICTVGYQNHYAFWCWRQYIIPFFRLGASTNLQYLMIKMNFLKWKNSFILALIES